MRSNHELAISLGISERQFYRWVTERRPEAMELLKMETLAAGGLEDRLTQAVKLLRAAAEIIPKFDPNYGTYLANVADNVEYWIGATRQPYRRFRFDYRKANGLLEKPVFFRGEDAEEARENVEWSEYRQGGPRPSWVEYDEIEEVEGKEAAEQWAKEKTL